MPHGIVFAILFVLAGCSVLTVAAGEPATPVNPEEAPKKILLFVPYVDAWFSEYQVVYRTLLAAGWEVERVSSDHGTASAWYSADVDKTPSAQSLDAEYRMPLDHGQFIEEFEALTGSAWKVEWNPVTSIPIDRRVQDIESLEDYAGIVLVGGRGVTAYRADGNFGSLVPGPGQNLAPDGYDPGANTVAVELVEESSLALSRLLSEALASGKPVLSQCHAGTILLFVTDVDGQSVAAGLDFTAYGFPDSDALEIAEELGAEFHYGNSPVVNSVGMVTTSDWFPDSSLYGAVAFLDLLSPEPPPDKTVSVLVVGNGVQTWGNYNGLPHPDTEPGAELHYANEDTVADVLLENSHGPSFVVDVLSAWTPEWGVAPLDLSQISLESFDVLVWFLHNDFSISDDPENGRFTNLVGLQNEELLLTYLDNGGGIVALHHAIWSGTQPDLEGNSIPLLTAAVGAELSFAAFNAEGTAFLGHAAEFRIRASGHYIVRNGIERPWEDLVLGPPEEMWFGLRFDPDLVANDSVQGYRRLFDYRGTDGTAVPAGWTRTYNPNGDAHGGRVVFLQPGETVERSFGDERYRQIVRNATAWAGSDE